MAKAKKEKEEKPKGGTLADFEARYKGTIVDPVLEAKRSGRWTTGSLTLDRLLRGGVSKGRMAEFYGPPGGGKSTLALKMIGMALADGVPCAYMDLEHCINITEDDLDAEGFVSQAKIDAAKAEITDEQRTERRKSWLRTNGVNPSDPNFRMYKPDSGEELFSMLAEIVQHDLFGIVVVDSVPQIQTKKQNDSEPGDATYGARAKLLAEQLPVLLRLYSNNLRTTILFINQVRENIGAQVKSQKSTGGYALDHDVRVKVKVQRIFRREMGDDVVADTRVKVEKNVFGPACEGMIRISAKRGIDSMYELIAVAKEFGYLHMSGNWHYFFEEPVTPDAFKAAALKKKVGEIEGYLAGQNGEASALDWMTNNGWETKLYALARKVG